MRGGAEARLAVIPSDGGKFGMFEQLCGTDDPRVFAEKLEAAARTYYGTAARAFLEYFTGHWDETLRECAAFIERFIDKNLPAGAAPEIRRILRRCALAAAVGEKVTELGITGWPPGEAKKAAIYAFKQIIERRGGTESADRKNAIAQVRGFIASQHARFYPANPQEITTKQGDTIRVNERIQNAAGFWKEIKGELIYLIYRDTFRKEVCRDFNHLTVAKELKACELLLTNEPGTLMYRPTIEEALIHPSGVGNGRPRLYAVRGTIVDFEHEPKKS
jgi:putative DNA primase/helicase